MECFCGAGIEAFTAGFAVGGKGRVGLQLEVCYKFSKEQLWAEGWVYEEMVFSDEAESCSLSESAFGERSGIDADFEFEIVTGEWGDEVRQKPKLVFYKVVVVLIAGVGSDFTGGSFGWFEICFRRFVVDGGTDDGFGGGEKFSGVCSFFEVLLHIRHLCGVAGIYEFFETVEMLRA